MAYQRDPLSPRYDGATGQLLGRAIAAPGKWQYVAVPRPGSAGRAGAWLRAHGIDLDATDAGGLTSYERAYQRSLYWNAKQLGISAPGGQWSLQREWGPATARGRLLGVRLSKAATARRAVNRKPARDQYWRNPAERSGGEGSTQQRFG